ncbi:hypothetical protein LP419_04245 [Massilia sp. H-1]|nr:hypothetical protein LP419_04245 [Massilia sp. H-1]
MYDTTANLTTALGREQEIKAHGVAATIEYRVSDTLLLKSVTASRRDKSYAPIDFDSMQLTDFHVLRRCTRTSSSARSSRPPTPATRCRAWAASTTSTPTHSTFSTPC